MVRVLLAVVDENNRLLGVITDGDIRRALLKGCGVDDNVNEAVNRSPIVGMENDDDFNHRRIMEDSNIDRLPITKLDGKFVRFEFRTKKTIPNAIPNLDGRETEYLLRAINQNHIAIGPEVDEFERAICRYTGAKYAVATNTGTSALHLALLVSDIKRDDIVITSSFTFAATVHSIYYMGAIPAFVDVDPNSLCLCPQK